MILWNLNADGVLAGPLRCSRHGKGPRRPPLPPQPQTPRSPACVMRATRVAIPPTPPAGARRVAAEASTSGTGGGKWATGTPGSEASAERFLRPHLLKLTAYKPIEPFEILSARVADMA